MTLCSRRRSPGLSGLRLLLCAVALLTGCAGRVAPPESDGDGLPPGVPAVSLPAPTPSAVPSATTAAPSGGPAADGPTDVAAGAPSGEAEEPAAPPGGGDDARTVLALRDAGGDQFPTAPAYADVIGVLLEDLGAGLRVTVQLAREMPAALPEGEVAGLGVDLFTSGAPESDHQLFADGSTDGWFAYLQTPEGFVPYPGQLALSGDRITFTLPWSAIGGKRPGELRAFLDWSRRGDVTNLASTDRAPDDAPAPYSP